MSSRSILSEGVNALTPRGVSEEDTREGAQRLESRMIGPKSKKERRLLRDGVVLCC